MSWWREMPSKCQRKGGLETKSSLAISFIDGLDFGWGLKHANANVTTSTISCISFLKYGSGIRVSNISFSFLF